VTAAPYLAPLGAWHQPGGHVTSWVPTPRTWAAVRTAEPSPVPASHQQAQHVRAYERFRAAGLTMARLGTVAWTEPGRCDLGAMTAAVDAHLQRHDTYADVLAVGPDGRLARSVIADPAAVRFEPGQNLADAQEVAMRAVYPLRVAPRTQKLTVLPVAFA